MPAPAKWRTLPAVTLALFGPRLRAFARSRGSAGLCATALLCACGDGVGQPIRAAALSPNSGGSSNTGGASTTGGSGGSGNTASYCDSVATWPASDVAAEQGVFSAIDTLRAFGLRCDEGGAGIGSVGGFGGIGGLGNVGGAVPALTLSPELTCSARRHARDMSERNYFSKVTPEGEQPETRMRLAGYASPITREIIARDQAQAYLVLRQLFEQQGDACAQLVDPRLVALGVGKFGSYWTIDLAGERSP